MPRDILTAPPPPPGERFAYGLHPSNFAEIRYPETAHPRGVAIMIHGGFWRARFDLAPAGHLCVALTNAGLITANLEYRRVGEEGGGWPGTFEDLRGAIVSVRAMLQPLVAGQDGCVLLGHSAGGHLALRFASEIADLRGVIGLGPVAVLRSAYDLKLGDNAVHEFLGDSLDFEAACPSRHSARVPRSVIHGVKDDVVPIELSRELVKLRRNDPEPVNLVEVPEADHFDVIDPKSAAWPVVRAEVLRLLL